MWIIFFKTQRFMRLGGDVLGRRWFICFWVHNAWVKGAAQDIDERICHDIQVAESQLRVVELTLLLCLIDSGENYFTYSIVIPRTFRAGACFGTICQHEQGGLRERGLGPG